MERTGNILKRTGARYLRVVEGSVAHSGAKPTEPLHPAHLPVVRKGHSEPTEFTCPICRDQGYTRADVDYGHPQFGKPVPCKCRTERTKMKMQGDLVESSGVMGMTRYENATFATFDQDTTGTRMAYRQSVAFARDPEGWLVLTGPCGCGKTHLAVSIAKERIERGNTVLVQTVPDLLDYLRSSFSPKAEETYSKRFDTMREVELLILDDFGAESTTPWATEKLFQLINYRYNMALPTVITTNNMKLEGVDLRIKSRFSDRDLVCIVEMENAQDYRPTQKRGLKHGS